MNDNVKILCCYYKDKDFVPSNDIYFPIQCGKASTGLDLGIQGDDCGENISSRNRFWSEITGLYWAWRNMNPVEYIGLCSYRRFFNFNHSAFAPITRIFNKSQYGEINNIKFPDIPKLLDKYDVIVPKQYYYAYSNRNVIRMNYYSEDFAVLEDVIFEKCPHYINSFLELLNLENKIYGHNMFIMKWSDFNIYCEWVFSILLEVEKRLSPQNYPVDKVRVYGYMHELLFTLYIYHNKLRVYESQLSWVTNDVEVFNFNLISYKLAAQCSFFFNKTRSKKLFGFSYKH